MLLWSVSLDYRVIHVDLYVLTYLFLKDFVHHPLVYSASILQSKRYDFVIVIAFLNHESHFFLIVRVQRYLVVPEISIHEA